MAAEGFEFAFDLADDTTEILQQSLIVARALGIDHVLLTCNADNAGHTRRHVWRCDQVALTRAPSVTCRPNVRVVGGSGVR